MGRDTRVRKKSRARKINSSARDLSPKVAERSRKNDRRYWGGGEKRRSRGVGSRFTRVDERGYRYRRRVFKVRRSDERARATKYATCAAAPGKRSFMNRLASPARRLFIYRPTHKSPPPPPPPPCHAAAMQRRDAGRGEARRGEAGSARRPTFSH